ncbi:MAG TPA: PDZ domain-containing protein [Polyangiaceae bacterium]|nr:PDZ domain-containing protein [Polyangiaceae bacterium]
MKAPLLLRLTFLAGTTIGCAAVYPEIAPPLKSPPAGRKLAPPPPPDLLYIDFASAEIPPTTRDGRPWDSLGGSLPDPFAKLIVDNREIIKTPIQSDTLKPTWPDQKRANYWVSRNAEVRLEVWDSNTLTNHPICIKRLRDFHDQAGPIPLEVDCDSGAHIVIRVEPAHARWGLGFNYELSSNGAAVSHVFPESPAARAGLKDGEEIVEIQGKKVEAMEEGEAQSLVNANAQVGVDLLLRAKDGAERRVTIKEGTVYPAVDDGVPL